MSFLEAQRIVREFRGGEPLSFLLALSGTPDPLMLYLRAAGALRGRSVEVRTLPFNTLGQEMLRAPRGDEAEVFLLLPWDFLPELDWRSGIPSEAPALADLKSRAAAVAQQLAKRSRAKFLYLPAAVPPVLSDVAEGNSLAAFLLALAASIGARITEPAGFAMASYLASGCPVASSALSEVATTIVDLVAPRPAERAKVLVTDLDNVLWAGVVAEDADQIAFSPEGRGFRHFIYQTYLLKLKQEGVLLAAVSRNDPDIALGPIRSRKMKLVEEDFVAVVASYQAKSAQIRELASRLNLGLEAFVFVDDNPIELAEVAGALPAVRTVPFPGRDQALPEFLHQLSAHFPGTTLTAEDRERTDLYRRRLEGMAPSSLEGADLSAFLRDLRMVLTIHDRSAGDRERVVQLINKTNQFNLNGRRVTDEEVSGILAQGGRLFGATLEDRHGSHGETLACLIDASGEIVSFVMSCRVFQRRMEHAFLAWLCRQPGAPRRLRFERTERNTPFQQFVSGPGFSTGGSSVELEPGPFADAHGADLALFEVKAP
jgi:FkbH-like protein